MRHAIEEEEKVPMEQVANFQEVTLREGTVWHGQPRQPGFIPKRVHCAPTACCCRGHRRQMTQAASWSGRTAVTVLSQCMTRLGVVGEFHRDTLGS